MDLEFSPESDFVPAFSTPIARFRLAGSDAFNAELLALLAAKERETPGTGRTNIGGWHSPGNIFEWTEPAIKTLHDWIENAMRQLVGIVAAAPEYECDLHIVGWANVLKTGGYNLRHNHPNHVFSGVYYADAGDSDPKDELSGLFEFMDPRPFVEMVPAPGAPFGRSFPITPVTGSMLLFPAWLYHHVLPYNGIRPRVSIAFNAQVANFRVTRTK